MNRRTLTTLPVTLQDGVQPLTVAFRMEPDLKRLRLHLPPLPSDLAPANNDFPLEIEVDRTKIHLAEPVKTLGAHQVEIRILPDVRATVTVAVEPA